ncbi:exonuclease domain-containing protein [Bacillaceae bacterium S4-13-58]
MRLDDFFQWNVLKKLTGLKEQDFQTQALLRQMEREQREHNFLVTPFEKIDFTIFDIETTGFNPFKGDVTLSIGAVKIQQMEITKEQFHTFIQYEEEIPEVAKKITGITEEDLKGGVTRSEAWRSFMEFAKSTVFVAHHAKHEKQFMRQEVWREFRQMVQPYVLDTAWLAGKLMGVNDNFALDHCCNHFEIQIEKRHHALWDATATAELLLAMIHQLRENKIESIHECYLHLT